jgi:hypothetical protein
MLRPLEVKKLHGETLAVRWSNEPTRWRVVNDPTIAAYLVFWMAKGPDHTSDADPYAVTLFKR